MRSLTYLSLVVALNLGCISISEAQLLSRELNPEEIQKIDIRCGTSHDALYFQVTNNNPRIFITELTFAVREGEVNSRHQVGVGVEALSTDAQRRLYLPVSYRQSAQWRRLSCGVVAGKTYRVQPPRYWHLPN